MPIAARGLLMDGQDKVSLFFCFQETFMLETATIGSNITPHLHPGGGYQSRKPSPLPCTSPDPDGYRGEREGSESEKNL